LLIPNEIRDDTLNHAIQRGHSNPSTNVDAIASPATAETKPKSIYDENNLRVS